MRRVHVSLSLMRVLFVFFCSSLCANGIGAMELDLGGRKPRTFQDAARELFVC